MPIQMPALPKTFGERVREMEASRVNDQQAELNAMRIEEARRGMRDDQTVRGILSQYGDDYGSAAKAAAQAGVGPDTVEKLYGRARDADDRKRSQFVQEIEVGAKLNKIAENVVDQGSWDAYRAQAQEAAGLFGSKVSLPEQYDPAYVDKLRARGRKFKNVITVQEGDEKVAYEVYSDGTRQEIGRGRAFKPEKPRGPNSVQSKVAELKAAGATPEEIKQSLMGDKGDKGAPTVKDAAALAQKLMAADVAANAQQIRPGMVPPPRSFNEYLEEAKTALGLDGAPAGAPPAADPGTAAPPAPAAPSLPDGQIPVERRMPGQTYQTRRGPMIWTGTGWRPPTPQDEQAGVTVDDIRGL